MSRAEGNAAINHEIREGKAKMKKMMKVASMVAALAMVLSGVAFSAGTIKIGHMTVLTGPTSEVNKPYQQGVQDYKDWINAHGGIGGKMIEMPVFDYAYDKNKAVNFYKKFKEDGVVAIQGAGTGDTEAVSAMTAADKIPYISASYSAHLADPKKAPYNFFCLADYTTALRAGLKYLKDSWKEKRAPKIVFIYPNHPYGIAPIKGGKEYAKELGFEVLGDEEVGLTAIEANSQLISLKNKGADFAWIGGTTNSAAVIMKNAKKLGVKTKFFVNMWGADETTPKLAEGAEEGVLVMMGTVLYGDHVPGMKKLMEITKNKPQMSHYFKGYVSMMVLVEALNRADKATGGKITGSAVKDALESFRNFDTGGLTAGKITYTSTDHRPFTSVNIAQFEKGKLVVKKTITLPPKAEWLGL